MNIRHFESANSMASLRAFFPLRQLLPSYFIVSSKIGDE